MLTEVFGSSPRVKLLDFLMDHPDFDYTISQMHEFTGISRPTLYPLTEELLRDGMIVMTREVGGSMFFGINVEHPKVVWMLRVGFEGVSRAVDAGRIGAARKGRPGFSVVRARGRPTRRARAKRV